MESGSNTELLGSIVQALTLLIKSHTPTKLSFEKFKFQFQLFADIIKEKAHGEVEIIQTGSSFDDLHMCRKLGEGEKEQLFCPSTDFDFMMIYTKFLVDDYTGFGQLFDESDLQTSLQESDKAFVMVMSDHTGYVKLLITAHGRKLLQAGKSKFAAYVTKDGYLPNDVFRRGVVLEPGTDVIYSREPFTQYVACGPAISNMEKEASQGYSYDFVHTFPCKDWPAVAARWSKRPRDAKWPSESLINEIMEDGCSVVPVGFYTSTDNLEWRLSFNMSERKLSLALNENQKACYCMVKLMIKEQLSSKAILSSYMVKNMMFWFCEQQYGEDEWKDQHLGARVIQLLDYICTALEHHNIPHYVLPANNLIQHKSEEDVKLTLLEVRQIRSQPFQIMLKISRKMQVFELGTDGQKVIGSAGEMTAMLTMFTTLVQTMMQLGLMNFDTHSFAIRCFRSIVAMNVAAKPFIKHSSQMFAASSVPELVKPFAVQYMQAGNIAVALALLQAMMDSNRELVVRDFPETITNIACLYACQIEMGSDVDKEMVKTKANDHFQLALRVTENSQSLHLAYGNFLKDSKISILLAVEQFKKAVAIEKPRGDDDALVQITIPSQKATSAVSNERASDVPLADETTDAQHTHASSSQEVTSTLCNQKEIPPSSNKHDMTSSPSEEASLEESSQQAASASQPEALEKTTQQGRYTPCPESVTPEQINHPIKSPMLENPNQNATPTSNSRQTTSEQSNHQATPRSPSQETATPTLKNEPIKTDGPVYVPGKVVAYYSLVDTLMSLGEVHEARVAARKFEAYIISSVRLNDRRNAFQLCGFSWIRSGLNVKGTLMMDRAKKYKTKY